MGFWRLLLAWMVIAVHTIGYSRLFHVDIGMVAVATFFFISGYLMPLAYRTNYASSSFGDSSRRFYVNRFLRIYPMYWAGLLVILALYLVSWRIRGTIDQAFLGWRSLAQNFLLLGLNQTRLWGSYHRMNNLAWTLDIELQYYLLTPLFVVAVYRFRKAVLAALLFPAFVSAYLVFHPTGLVDVDRSLIAWFVFFFAGFVFYESKYLQRIADRGSLVATAATVCFVIAATINQGLFMEIFVVLGFLAISAYLLVAQKQRRFGALDKAAGDLSYPVYILNMIVVGFAAKYLAGPATRNLAVLPAFALGLFLNVLVATLFAYLALRLIANPIELLRGKFKTSGPRGAVPEPLLLNGVGATGY